LYYIFYEGQEVPLLLGAERKTWRCRKKHECI